jgi:hypothetical protein
MKLFRYEQLQQEAKVNDSLIVREILCKYCPHKNPQHSRLQQKFYWRTMKTGFIRYARRNLALHIQQ